MDDADTISLIKFYLHDQVKKNVFREYKYEEMLDVQELNYEFGAMELLKGKIIIETSKTETLNDSENSKDKK